MTFKLSFLKPDIQLPLVIEPEETLSSICLQDLLDWLIANKSFISEKLHQYGGILFRGFPISTAAEFNSVVQTIEPRTLSYVEGQSPRTKVHDQIYTSTEYPANQTITLHNELSYTHNPPRKIFFFCEIPPQIYGETPITDCRKIYEKMDPQIRDRFIAEKIRYVKNMHGGNQFGKSWQQTFETSDRNVVENYLKEKQIDFAWGKDGGLTTTQIHLAAIQHPDTEEMCWFNQASLWHYLNLGAMGDQLLQILGEKNLPTNAYYGNGAAIESGDLDAIRQLLWNEATFFSWRKGDVLMLDNILVAHGRNHFQGDRRILVAMT